MPKHYRKCFGEEGGIGKTSTPSKHFLKGQMMELLQLPWEISPQSKFSIRRTFSAIRLILHMGLNKKNK